MTRLPVALTLLIVLLAGCAATPERKPVMPAAQAWRLHRRALGALQTWTVSGRIAIQTPSEAWNASIYWSQTPAHYRISVVGPLGSGSFRLDGDALGVVLQTPKDGAYSARDPDTLMEDVLGLRMPVSGLRYWILGLPAPGPTPSSVLDVYGRLAHLHQDGWQIDYKRYRQVHGLDLPDKVFLSNDHYGLRLVVSEWLLMPSSRAAPHASAAEAVGYVQ